MTVGARKKSLRSPDETEPFTLGIGYEIHLGELTVGRNVHQPGWRWSEHVRPVVGGTSCQVHHTAVVIGGRAHFRHDDGSELDLEPDDVFDVTPGHDAWVVGDEPFVTIDWVGAHRWASPRVGHRLLATILLTDIVDSTARVAEVGDEAWGRTLERYYAAVRRSLDRFGGREIVTTGDGMLSLFDGAERTILAAMSIARAAEAELGLSIRAGVHTGEVELVPNNVRGVAVHVAARIMALARPGEVLVSDTTRGLIDGEEVRFSDRGVHQLRGVSGPRALFVAGHL